jgi:outer membrane lipoprotein-sorting protein
MSYLRFPFAPSLMILGVLLAPGVHADGAAAAVAAPSADTVLRAVDAILAPERYSAVIAMHATRPDGTTNAYSYRVLKSGPDLLLLNFDKPSLLSGHAVLRRGDDLYRYIPSLKRAMRISGRADFESGDFRNADVLRVHLARDYRATSMTVDGDALLLDLTATTNEAAYDRIRLWVSRADFMPLREELYAASGKLLRSLTCSNVKDFGKHRAPSQYTMVNQVSLGRSTVMTLQSFTIEAAIPDARFSVETMGR